MSNWEVISKDDSLSSLMAGFTSNVLTAGLIGYKHEYRIRNTDTGEERTVLADDDEDLGNKIASGEFDDELFD